MSRHDLSRFSHRDLSDLRASRSRSLSRGYSRGYSSGNRDDSSRDDGRDLSLSRDELSRGRGRIRTLSSGDQLESEAIMAMTRRDADNISREAVRDTDRFLSKRRDKDCEKPINPIVAALEVFGAAGLAGYLAQRYRGSGAILPIGIVAGLLGHVAAYYNVFGGANHIRNISNGAIGGAGAIWLAGIGSLANENVQGPTTGNLIAPQQLPPQPLQTPPPRPYAPVYAYPQSPPFPAHHMAPSVADYQNLSRNRSGRAA